MKGKFILTSLSIFSLVISCSILLYFAVIKEELIDSIVNEELVSLSFSAEVLAYNFSHEDTEQVKNWLTLKSELDDVKRIMVISTGRTIIASNYIADEGKPLLEVEPEIFNFISSNQHVELVNSSLRLMQPIYHLGTNSPSHYLYLKRDISSNLEQLESQVFYLSLLLFFLFLFFFFLFLKLKRLQVKSEIYALQKALSEFNDGSYQVRATEHLKSDFYSLQCSLNDSFALNEHLQNYLKEQAQFADLVNGLVTDAIIETDQLGIITHVNTTAVTMFGYENENELIGSSVALLIPTRYQKQHHHSMTNRSDKLVTGHVLNEVRNVEATKKNGEEFPVEIVISQYEVSKQSRFVAFLRDISSIKEYERSIEQLAYFDSLTAVLNLNGLRKHIHHQALPLQFSVLELSDLQDFNDVYGNKLGDKYLCNFVAELKLLHLEHLLIARIRSGRFLVIHSSSLKEESKQFHKLHKREILLNDLAVKIRFVRCTAKLEHIEKLDELLELSGLALREPENRVVGSVVKIDMEFVEGLKYQAWLKQALEKAIEKEELYFAYQPKFDTQTLKPCAAEALMRWQCDGKAISPGVFISLAEKKGLMPQLDRYVIKTVCKQIRRWLDMGLHVLPISINLSARHLFEQDTITAIFEHVGEFDIPPHMLEVEVTEYGLIKDYKKTAINMMRLEKAGISVAIDDYGTGHANLETVLSLPIKHLKIDQSFIRLGMKSVKGQAILENIISLAKSLKVVTTAEGVETKEQLEYLKNAQCDAIQGFLLSKPMLKSDFELLMKELNNQERKRSAS